MLVKYKKQSIIAAGVWLVTLALMVLLASISLPRGYSESFALFVMVLIFTSIGTYWFSFWSYAKAKGYSGVLGLLLPLLNILGLIILAVLRDKHPEAASDVGTTKLAGNTPTLDEKLQEDLISNKNKKMISGKSKILRLKDFRKIETDVDLDFKEIIQNIASQLSGDAETDIDYLLEARGRFLSHEYSVEICRAIGRLIYDILPDENKNKIEEYYEKLGLSADIILAEAKSKIAEGDLDGAENIILSIFPDDSYFKEDSESVYFCCNNPFEAILHYFLFKPQKKVRFISNFITKCSMIYAYILFEKGDYEKALIVLDNALYYNPVELDLLFEKTEIFKVKKDWKSFKESNDICLNVSYTPHFIARAYRNYGYMYIELSDFDTSICCYLLSSLFEKNEHTNSQLFYISQVNKQIIDHEIYFKKLPEIFDKHGIPYGPSEIVRSTAITAAKHEEEVKKSIEGALYYYEIYYLICKDEKILEHIQKLKNSSEDIRRDHPAIAASLELKSRINVL